MLTTEGDVVRAKVGDFGLSRIIPAKPVKASGIIKETAKAHKKELIGTSSSRLCTLTCGEGTPNHMAPELVDLNFDKRLVSVKVDVYAFGIMMWECAEFKQAWANFHWNHKIFAAVCAGERPRISSSWSPPRVPPPDGYIKLMTRCWEQDAHHRPGFRSIFSILSDMLDIESSKKEKALINCKASAIPMISEVPMLRETTLVELSVPLLMK